MGFCTHIGCKQFASISPNMNDVFFQDLSFMKLSIGGKRTASSFSNFNLSNESISRCSSVRVSTTINKLKNGWSR